jgi:transcription termination/antitermination protein NusG
VSDELDKLIPDPIDIPEKAAETDASDAAELAAAESEGMSVSADPVDASAPPVESVPYLTEQPPIAPETPVAETPVEKPARSARQAPPAPLDKPEEPKSDKMDWYILKVQSNREESIREALLRRVAIAGLERYFGDVIVPTEKVTEFKGGKKRIIKRKLYPGYIVVHMEINDDTWFMVRETPGIGDFTGAAGRPSVMLPHEVQRIVAKAEEKSEKAPKLKIGFSEGERVKIKEGTFENFEGDVESIDQTNGQVTVMINIFGRSTPVTLEYWQIEAL